MIMASAPVRFEAGLQTVADLSTVGTELIATMSTMKRIVFCSNVMTQVYLKENFQTVQLFIDNTSTNFVIGNRAYSACTKHVALRFLYIWELVKEGKTSIHNVPTHDQLADIGTTHLNKQRHRDLINKSRPLGLNGTGGTVEDLSAFAGNTRGWVSRPTR